MPEWPTEDPFDNGKRFYVLKNSEMQDNDWIRLYLELAVAKYTSDKKDPDLSNLKIVNVAIDIQDLNEGLNAKNATVYISYKDEARVGKDVDRIAIARRNFDERTGCFSLMGKHQSLEIIPKKGENQSEDDPCDDVDHIRRSFYEHTRCFNPKNQDLSAENKCKYQRVIRRLRVIKPWRFSSPRRWQPEPYRKSCCRCTPRLHKTRSI
ncbi:unnamed protein product [Arabidopsis lyrata]|nr:UPF0725 protein At3g25080 [Arabidopsis lyrata subsp. lyrata]XP_020883752.1 UPF0725 protein At3g25080 [Arabidopsis lyrata subsp. lyrata]EFH38711.1 hypothetical protein ARALYDRAFT_359607 [Arabidopsis lyrata subsp. lyrata]CAH8265302.1 unnamed protein product [Arabidopsis lyrata]|eukprot:XP_002862453.1 UPF0725 protein At3g25080 [Arabidopsis lyrata subsp. lyrata]